MSETPPTPPEILTDDIVDTFEDYSPETLREVARYAEALAEYRERAARLAEADGAEAEEPAAETEKTEDESLDRPEDAPDEVPDDVPSKATITIKEINDNRYYYWQWRKGDEIKSQYEGPVTPSE